MKKYRCILCGYIYDDSKEEVKFEDLPDDWVCPLCGASKKDFELIEDKKESGEIIKLNYDTISKAKLECIWEEKND